LAIALLLVANLIDAAEEFPCRSGKFVILESSIIQHKPMKLSSLIGSFDITVHLRNETKEDWIELPLDVDVFEPDGTQLGAEVVPHTFRISTHIRAGEERTFTINRARSIPKPVVIARMHISLSQGVAQAVIIDPGPPTGF